MSRQVLGKRSRSHCRLSSPSPSRSLTPSIKTRRVTRDLPSPDPSPCPKRVKIYPITDIEQDDSSNKENIPPNSNFGSLTPRRTTSRLSLRTPPPTPEYIPLPSPTEGTMTMTTTLHTQVRALLRPQRNVEQMICREDERICIRNFLTSYLLDESHTDAPTSLYISGAPGTGKSALVNEILTSISMGDFPKATGVMNTSVHIVYVNCMALGVKSGLTGVWERCAQELHVIQESKRGIATKLDWGERFGKLLRGKKCILVLDEIDHLVASDPTIMSVSQVFAITTASQTCACLRIIGISNTHTLNHTKSSPDTQTIHFEPYTAAQMRAILSSRLATLSNHEPDVTRLFPTATLALLTMKIANQTGDIRTVFSVARRSLDIAAAESTPFSGLTVTPGHVLAAMKASHASIDASRRSNADIVTRVRNLGLHARFALAALLLATRRVASGLALIGRNSNASSGRRKETTRRSPRSSIASSDGPPPTIDLTVLHGFYGIILSKGTDAAFCGVGRTEFTDLINHLEGSGLVQLVSGHCFGTKTHRAKKTKGVQEVCIIGGIREDELVRGLVGLPSGENTANVIEEEVKHVWEKEVARIDREVKARFKDTSAKAPLAGAVED